MDGAQVAGVDVEGGGVGRGGGGGGGHGHCRGGVARHRVLGGCSYFNYVSKAKF